MKRTLHTSSAQNDSNHFFRIDRHGKVRNSCTVCAISVIITFGAVRTRESVALMEIYLQSSLVYGGACQTHRDRNINFVERTKMFWAKLSRSFANTNRVHPLNTICVCVFFPRFVLLLIRGTVRVSLALINLIKSTYFAVFRLSF